MGITEVTQAQWEAVMSSSPSFFKGDDLPVEQVSWGDAVDFCRRASRLVGKRLRLPTEAEWEYACRAGSTTAYGGGGILHEMGWSSGTSGGKTHAVGQRQPNAWGLYDMHGNVAEWCNDWFGHYDRGEVIDPRGEREGTKRIVRGGSWDSPAPACRSASRTFYEPNERYYVIGFRCVLEQ